MKTRNAHRALALGTALALLAFGAAKARAHCDTMDGPVVKDAAAALASRDVTPVLKWVAAEKEAEIRRLFEQAVAVRALGPQAKALADRAFLEGVVRVHREGEGAPYTGLKPAGTEIAAAAAEADRALEEGSPAALADRLAAEVQRGLKERFARAAAARVHAGENVQRGREYVAAYVKFVHYAENVDAAVSMPEDHGSKAQEAPAGPHRHP